MQLLTKTPLNRCPVRYVKKWPTYQETGFSLYYVFKMKKSQNVKDFVKIEGRERGKVECVPYGCRLYTTSCGIRTK